MSNTVSSALLIMRRVETYLLDVSQILRHEIPNYKETEEMIKLLHSAEDQIDLFMKDLFQMTDEILWFFGGYKATSSDMALWKASADHQNIIPYVTTFPYPIYAGAGAESAVEDFKGMMGGSKTHKDRISELVERIGNLEDHNHVIVGHSSGCAISNEIAFQAYHKGYKNFRLIGLDGFTPHPVLFENKLAQSWSAKCGKIKSMNYDALSKTAGPYFHVYNAVNCTSKWALHFSLVNKASSDTVVRRIPDGYKHCIANLDWLK